MPTSNSVCNIYNLKGWKFLMCLRFHYSKFNDQNLSKTLRIV